MFISKPTTSIISVISLFAYLSLPIANATQQELQQSEQLPKNIIMVVADGMGPAYTSAYRYFKDDPTTPTIEQTVFDRHLKGLVTTNPAKISGYVTDSAAAATALASGIKTYNGAIGVDVNKQPVLTVLEWAKQQGKKTGVVVTSRINHATPASYLAHNESRKNYEEIADSYIDEGIKADVYLGGGWNNFIRDDRNIVDEFKDAGFQYIDNYKQLNTLDKTKPLLGLFAEYGLPWALDDSNKHRLTPLTKTAIAQLDNKHGFFMLVEASQIDWAGHSNDIAAAMHEMDDLAKVMEYLEVYVEDNPDTLVILTADHSTGGFTLAADKEYRWDPEVLRTIKESPESIATKILAKGKVNKQEVSQWLNFELTTKEMKKLNKVDSNFKRDQAKYGLLSANKQKEESSPELKEYYVKSIKLIIDKRTNTGWTTSGHTAINVPLFVFGKQSDQFSGQYDNTDIANKIFTLLGRTDTP